MEWDVRATARYLEKEQVQLEVGPHALRSDHPKRLGGEDLGPSPGELLMAALAAWAAVHVGRLATRKGYPLDSVVVKTGFEMGHEKIDGPVHALTWMQKVHLDVEIKGELTPEQYRDLEFIARNCSLGNTLRKGVEIAQRVEWVRA